MDCVFYFVQIVSSFFVSISEDDLSSDSIIVIIKVIVYFSCLIEGNLYITFSMISLGFQ